MKKLIKIIFIIVLPLMITTTVFATTNVTINELEYNEEDDIKLINVKIISDETIGVVSGKIEKSSNIDIISIEDKNGWSITYNEEMGDFNTFNAYGSKNDEIFTIKYKINNKKNANIDIKNINVTNIEYNTETINDVEYKIKQNNIYIKIIICIIIFICIITIYRKRRKV